MVLLEIPPQYIGIAAGVFTSTSLMPQLVKMIKEKSAKEISVVMILVLMTGLSLWIYYGTLKQDWPIILTNAFAISVNLAILFFKIKYNGNARR